MSHYLDHMLKTTYMDQIIQDHLLNWSTEKKNLKSNESLDIGKTVETCSTLYCGKDIRSRRYRGNRRHNSHTPMTRWHNTNNFTNFRSDISHLDHHIMFTAPIIDLSGNYSDLFTRIENPTPHIIITNHKDTKFQRIDQIRRWLCLEAAAMQSDRQYQRAALLMSMQRRLCVLVIKYLDTTTTEGLKPATTLVENNNQLSATRKPWLRRNSC